MQMVDARAIADHGLIGDLQTVALIETRGTIDVLCLPRIDSPTVIAMLFDPGAGPCDLRATHGGRLHPTSIPRPAA